MKVGKLVAICCGGTIIILQIANNEGYITIDWSKITKKANKLADKAEEAITGEGPSWADKVSMSKIALFCFDSI
jgi:FUN14 domain-containing protein 1